MNTIEFRTATINDLPDLLKFEQGIIEFERPFDSNLKDNTTYYDLEAMMQSDNVKILVVQTSNTIVASGYAKIIDAKPYHKNPKYAYMGFMYVDPEYRGQGIIQTIIEDLKTWAKSKNIFEARLEVYSDNASAIKAYEKNGFKKHMVEMKILLD